MKVAVTAQLRNGLIWEAVNRAGSQTELARYLGVTVSQVCAWVNFRSAPDLSTPRGAQKWAEADMRFTALMGHPLEDAFPPEIRSKAFLKREKRLERMLEMPPEALAAMGAIPQLPPAPDDLVFASEGQDAINQIVETLKPNYQKVIRMRFGLDTGNEATLDEIANEMGISRGRVGQIEACALRQMRHPAKSKTLREFHNAA